jgi:hypothetical protein
VEEGRDGRMKRMKKRERYTAKTYTQCPRKKELEKGTGLQFPFKKELEKGTGTSSLFQFLIYKRNWSIQW